jgi:hypothetical protein
MTFFRLIFFIVIGWVLVRWLARWIAGAGGGKQSKTGGGSGAGQDYESLTDQKIEDADYEDL